MRRPGHLVLLGCVLGLVGMQAWYTTVACLRRGDGRVRNALDPGDWPSRLPR